MLFAKLLRTTTLLLATALASIAVSARAQPARESHMKAAFVYNFVLFTDWPPVAIEGRDSLNICVNANSDMAEALRSLNGKAAKGNRIKVIEQDQLGRDASACHVLYVSHDEQSRWADIRKAFSGTHALIISDDAEISQRGVMIALAVENNKMVFDVDQQIARQSQLSFSSKLMRLARSVK